MDGETLVQNVQKPYLFITFKPYADKRIFTQGDISEFSNDNNNFAPLNMQMQEKKATS